MLESPSSPAGLDAMVLLRCRPLHSLLLAAGVACASPPQPPPATLSLAQDHADVRGVVRDNVKGCEVDGPCYLVLESSDAPVHVEYHHGEAPRCDNAAAARTGLTIKPGDVVRARGQYRRTASFHFVDVCCPECVLSISTH